MSDRDYSAIADPELIARLASWFGEGPLPAPDFEHIEREAQASALAELEAVLDVEMCSRIESRRTVEDVLFSWANKPLESVLDPTMPRGNLPFPEPETFQEHPEYEQPDDIRHALREENTPQAVLRDLYRPVNHFGDIWFHRPERRDQGEDPTFVVRTMMLSTWGIPDWQPAQRSIDSDLAELRSSLSAPWEDSAVDLAARQADKLENDSDDDFNWMAMEGGYDPDL